MIHLIAIALYVQTHLLSILLAIVASFAVGFTWHGPLFGKQWMAANNITPPKKEDMKFSMMCPGICANIVMIFFQSAVLGRTFQILNLANIWEALLIATVIWLPFTALVTVNTHAWLGKSVKATLLDVFFNLASIWAVAAILYATL